MSLRDLELWEIKQNNPFYDEAERIEPPDMGHMAEAINELKRETETLRRMILKIDTGGLET